MKSFWDLGKIYMYVYVCLYVYCIDRKFEFCYNCFIRSNYIIFDDFNFFIYKMRGKY